MRSEPARGYRVGPCAWRSRHAYLPATSGWVETWRLSVNYSLGVATRYSTASEATGCRHSTSVLRVLVIIECRHPVASLAVLYWSCDHVGVLPHSTDFSHGLGSEVVLTSLHSNRPFLSNTLMEHHLKPGDCQPRTSHHQQTTGKARNCHQFLALLKPFDW